MRNRRACDACRQRKIQCDGDASSPTRQCNWCSSHGKACTFHGVKAREVRSKLNPGFNDDLTSQFERVEKALSDGLTEKSKVQPVSTTSDTSITCRSNGAHSASPEGSTSLYAGLLLGQNRCHSGIPLFTEEDEEWIYSRTGEKADFRNLSTLRMGQRIQRPAPPHVPIQGATDLLCVLPSRAIVKAFLDAFHQSTFRLAFPVIDYTLFQETIAAAYEASDTLSSLKHTTAKVCVLAFLSMVGLFHGKLSFLPPMDWDACYNATHSFLPHILDEATMENLQTILMLYLRQRYLGRSASGAIYHSIACRMAFMLGGHTNRNTKSFSDEVTRQERQTRHIRLLFWHCYIFDKDIALRTGQPPFISDKYCDLTLPEGYIETHFVLPLPGHDISSSFFANESLVPFLPGELRLSMLKHKTYELLYSVQALAKSDSEVIRAILELDDELESWRLSLPKVVRPALSISDLQQPVSDLKMQHRMQHVALHLEYHHLIVTIHRAGARCIANNPDTSLHANESHAAIKSSIALCLEASRSTLFYLREVIDDLAGEIFWVTVFYPTAATMMLFLHVLAEPLAPQAKADLELLSSAADLIRSMPIQRLTPHEIGHIRLVNDFITELTRLGNCAIFKAEMEMGTDAFGIEECT
ncbi:hypothetical protein BGZ61DRAFT_500281 [Ilyonectria robusta]|uniref:uncharacterized protein n=1 Tax=Ilyonectria robusta TaxID=1079257 RepID=UPI001E8DE795|nr:uncharacterized protein BGZ61DRAFT_500281 [Ilyonectria robusta]KAH8656320.1 hypothetical protein BGZ61DRAFT_500281 [Ilyonectria robusta]